ncbi:shikimate O-hydroxycinnamoyltransferase-like [Magnolia sinica]|uniref:shikimate O-hydroxycinnamoyltransferase-like n=1 Tax=Magnolia sinica TaxID=86752 RepID=UPI002659A1C1|nr:shikimate O-hydroxycinnamoyltransferase-like [Magnolia sinica]
MVRLKGSCTIKPAKPTPNHRLWLPDLDLIMTTTHAPLVYFYERTDAAIDFFSPEFMKDSLSRALVKYYPLAGRLHPGPSDRLELECNATGVLFVEAESDAQIDDFGDFKPGPGLRELVPNIDYNTYMGEWPLLLVQLTLFRCGGVCMGIGINHTIVDGSAVFQFISEWARIARGDAHVGIDPFFDRTILRARDPPVPPAFKHEEYDRPPLMLGHVDDHEVRSKETTVEMLRLTREQVNKIRQQATGCSLFQSVAGHVWRAACKARGLHHDQPTKMFVPVNGRGRLHPRLPDGYFGNVLFITTPAGRCGDLVLNPLSHSASRVKEAVEMMTDDYLRSALDFFACHKDLTPFRRGSYTLGWTQGTFYGCPNINVTSWLGMPIYDADFGWGPPIHMGPAALGFEGKAYLIPTREGDGSMLLPIRLQVAHMKAFKDSIYHGLQRINASL